MHASIDLAIYLCIYVHVQVCAHLSSYLCISRVIDLSMYVMYVHMYVFFAYAYVYVCVHV